MTDKLINPNITIDHDSVVRKDQYITDDYLDGLAESRFESTAPSKDLHRFASIPVVVIEKWMREGFDVLNGQHTAKEIMDRLRSEDLDAFITTNKRL